MQNPIVLGYTRGTEDIDSFLSQFSLIRTSRNSPVSRLVGTTPIEIVCTWADQLVNRLMSGDMSLGIAKLGDLVMSFWKYWKIPLNESSQFWRFDKEFRWVKPILELIWDGMWENWFDDANRFWFKRTGEFEEIHEGVFRSMIRFLT